ncbi:MAG: cobyrinate a,c-diamide synthase [Arenicellales bacterium]
MSRIFISATRKSSGKTTFAVGLCAALRNRGIDVQPFKKGPDYIDPMWLSRVSDRPCINLDFNSMTREEMLWSFVRHQPENGISVIEGNKGLFDGLDLYGSDSNAALAKMLNVPIILVVDVEGMTRGIAPLIQGYLAFEPEIKISGLVLNNLGGARHESKLRDIVKYYTDLELLGVIQRNPGLKIVERHLGLTTDKEDAGRQSHIQAMTEAVETQINIDRIIELAGVSGELTASSPRIEKQSPLPVSIGIARDSAFCFYYADDIEAMEQYGATIRYFDTLNDGGLPDVDAIFIGGGFPETHGELLEKNVSMRNAIRDFAESGRPVYAECGGLMYLSRKIRWQGKTREMVGAIPADVDMHERPIGRGYVLLEPTSDHPWLGRNDNHSSAEIKAHEFHYSNLSDLDPSIRFAYRVKRGHGVDGEYDGIVHGSVFANFAHMRDSRANPWVSRFLDAVHHSVASRAFPIKKQATTNL